MHTTLNKIRKKSPCGDGWNNLLKSLNKIRADDEIISFKSILNSNGIDDAIWCLRTLDYKEFCLFCADVAELSLPIFEKKYPNDKRPRLAIEGIRLYKSDKIDLDDLKKLRTAAAAAAAADYAAAAASADYAAASAAYAAASASAAASAAYAYASAAASADYAAASAASADAKKEQRKKIEKLFIKHFC